ncbi:MAG: S1/P1 nuclease [Verrucomicrobiota bacterium]
MKLFDRVRTLLVAVAVLAISAQHVHAYGQEGHHIVGAIADERLANTPTGRSIAQLLDGMTLREAAQVPDTIKGWDKIGIEDPKALKYFSSRPRIAEQLREFWKANQPTHDPNSPMPSHHWFHYTDVPVEAAKYSSGKTGRNQWDIVHMITYCVAVLRGEIPEENPRKITKPIAVILLAHYVGDIHQTVHVGAQYFDQSGHKVNPDLGKPALEDQGGNSISLEVSGGNSDKPKKLHSFWDGDPVLAMFPGNIAAIEDKDSRRAQMDAAEKNLVHQFASQEPRAWRLPASLPLKDYAEAWADEILPLAREAHDRLTFQEMTTKVQDDGSSIATGSAREKPMPDHLSYRAWSAMIVRAEIHKAGWRLADLLEKAVTPGNTPSASVPPPVSSVEASVAPSPAIVAAPIATPQASAPSGSPYGVYPANYKEIVTTWLKTKVPDPANTQIQWQTEPRPADLPGLAGRKLYGYLVIFSTSSKNGAAPAGRMQTHAALIHDGHVVKANGF